MTFNIDTIPENLIKEFLGYLVDNANTYTESQFTDFKKYRVDDKVECVVCLTENATVKCDTGNHLYACSDCYEKLRLTTDDRCPVCRAPNTIPLIVDEPPPLVYDPPPTTFPRVEALREVLVIRERADLVVYPYWISYDTIEALSQRLVDYIERCTPWNLPYLNLDAKLHNILLQQPLDLILELIKRDKCLYIFTEEDRDEVVEFYFGVYCTHRKRVLILKDLNDFNKAPADREMSMYKQEVNIDRHWRELTNQFGKKKYIIPSMSRSVRCIFRSKDSRMSY
jgi:hypothetical protein